MENALCDVKTLTPRGLHTLYIPSYAHFVLCHFLFQTAPLGFYLIYGPNMAKINHNYSPFSACESVLDESA